MSDSSIVVTYSGAEGLLDSAAFAQLVANFSHHLPLRNLHWKPSPSYASADSSSPFEGSLPQPASIRTIQSLDVRLEPLADTLLRTKLKPETRHLIQRSLLERPYCHLYFVVCDDSDTYRSQIRSDIRAWLSTLQNSPILSAANVTAKGFQGIESLQHHTKNGSSTSLTNGAGPPRSSTPPILRPDTPDRKASTDEVASPSASTSKEKLQPPSPEYLIILISPPEGSALPPSAPSRGSPAASHRSLNEAADKQIANKSGLGRFYSSSSSTSKNSVVDKVKADFNTSRRERVIHMTRLPSLHSEAPSRVRHSDPTIFAELLTRLKECVSATFDAVVESQGDIVKKEGQKRGIPGWNFCKWMAGMECVASTFEGVGLYSDALAQFEQVEAAFLQCFSEHNLPFFFHVGGNSVGDDSAPLLDISKKNYRDLILRNEITLFDFCSYVFAKRAILLGKLGRIAQVMAEAPVFLSRVASMLQSESLAPFFLESWIFSCSIDVVEQCQAWLVARGDMAALGADSDLDNGDERSQTSMREAQISAAFHSAKAELLDLARRQLDKIGITTGHLPAILPFTLSLNHGMSGRDRRLPPIPRRGSDAADQREDQGSITRQELLSAIDSREVFDLHYISLTDRIVAGWTNGGRRRNVMRLRCTLGSLDFVRDRYAESYAKFTALSEPYAAEKWSEIEMTHLAKQLECHARLEKAHDRAWVSVVVASLNLCLPGRASVGGGDGNRKSDCSTRWLDPQFLFAQLREHTRTLGQEVPISKFEPIEVQISPQQALLKSDGAYEGMTISIDVLNKLACPVEVDDVRLCLINAEGREIWFTSSEVKLHSGVNNIVLSCYLFIQAGTYLIDISQIRLSKVIVQYQHRNSKEQEQNSKLIVIPEDGDAADVDVQLGRKVRLDQSRTCRLCLCTGRNSMEKADVRLLYKDSRDRVRGLMEAKLGEEEGNFVPIMEKDADEGVVRLFGLPERSMISLHIPLLDFVGAVDGTVPFLAEVDYWSKEEAPTSTRRKRQIRTELHLSIGLPLGVNVQDFFRTERLFSKFLITAGAGGALKIGGIKLECENQGEAGGEDAPFDIVGPSCDKNIFVHPADTASFLFCLQRRRDIDGRGKGSNRNLRLTLLYKTAQEEAIQHRQASLERLWVERGQDLPIALRRSMQRFVTSTSTSGSATLPAAALASRRQLQKLLSSWAAIANCTVSQIDTVVSIIQEVMVPTKAQTDLTAPKSERQEGEWQELSLLLDVPRMSMVNAVTIKMQRPDEPKHVGQIVQATFHIESSFYWDEDDEDIYAGQKETADASIKNRGVSHPNGHQSGEEDEESEFEDAKSEAQASSAEEEEQGDADKTLKSGHARSQPRVSYLSVDVHCDFLHWLVVGSKRQVIQVVKPVPGAGVEASEKASTTLEISLIPLQSGQLCLPGITILPLPGPMDTSAQSHAHRNRENNAIQYEEEQRRQSQARSITCDTHIVNEAETVTVLPSLQRTDRSTYWMRL